MRKEIILLSVMLFIVLAVLVYAEPIEDDVYNNATLVWNPHNLSKDNSTYDIEGVPTGNPTFDTEVFLTGDGSVDFDGVGDRIEFVDQGQHDNMNNFTAWCAFNFTLNVGSAILVSQESSGPASGNDGTWSIFYDGGSNRWRCTMGVAGAVNAFVNTEFNDGKWHFAACTINKTGATESTVTLFIDGFEGRAVSTATFKNTSTGDFVIGGQDNTGNAAWDGFVDECGAVNYSLSGAELMNLYNRTMNGTKVQAPVAAVVDPCDYVSGVFNIALSDDCVINDLQDAGSNPIHVTGSSGSLTIASGGTLQGSEFHFTPDTLDGTNIFSILEGGTLSIKP